MNGLAAWLRRLLRVRSPVLPPDTVAEAVHRTDRRAAAAIAVTERRKRAALARLERVEAELAARAREEAS